MVTCPISPFRSLASANIQNNTATFFILAQNSRFDNFKAASVEQSITKQSERLAKRTQVYIPHLDFPEVTGFWAVWTLFSRIHSLTPSEWYIFLESDSHINGDILFDYLQHLNPREKYFVGHGLRDENPVIIHHFYGYDSPDEEQFLFPDSACGFVLSRGLLDDLAKSLGSSSNPVLSLFSIDAKHEVALYIFIQSNVRLLSSPHLFCPTRGSDCAIFFELLILFIGHVKTRWPPLQTYRAASTPTDRAAQVTRGCAGYTNTFTYQFRE
ncbi:hypothetical protein Y032_0541g3175 [Ancylostoma ceylanicum]|nr:hypothetical protein Y032_0541g3175 [Ancylostoma ceylanicum]